LNDAAVFGFEMPRDTWYEHLSLLPSYYENISDETSQTALPPEFRGFILSLSNFPRENSLSLREISRNPGRFGKHMENWKRIA
jgi:hypothetical protein